MALEAMKLASKTSSTAMHNSADRDNMESTVEQKRAGQGGKTSKSPKTQITLRLNSDIVHWLRAYMPEGRGYQTESNRVLRECVAGYEQSESGR